MGQLFGSFFRFVRFLLTLSMSVILVLWSASWALNHLTNIRQGAPEVITLQEVNAEVLRFQEKLLGEISGRMHRASSATLQQLDMTIREVEKRIEQLRRENDRTFMPAVVRFGPDAIRKQLREAAVRSIELELRQQERDYLVDLRAHFVLGLGQKAAARQLEQLRLAYLSSFANEQRARKDLLDAQTRDGWLAKIPLTPAYKREQKLAAEVDKSARLTTQSLDAFRIQKQAMARLAPLTSPPIFHVDEQGLAQASAFIRNQLEDARKSANNDLLATLYREIEPLLGKACMIVLGYFAVPAAIRSFFYFVAAPIAARRPPILIGKASDACRRPVTGERDAARISAVSKRVLLSPDEEMLVRHDYCQSKPQMVSARTKWLFDWAYPLSSIAAHMWQLTRINTAQAAEIVVSSTVDPLAEIALLELAAGEVFILQARGLVGAVYQRGRRPKIRSHWRLGTLHAWLTLQLRYLSFEGPATLMVKGCRGVRLEAAASGRSISQQATLGFSAGTAYSTVRNEPFWPYLLGEQPLLQDRFEGPRACYLYEEVPWSARDGTTRRSPVEAMVDAALKAFGM